MHGNDINITFYQNGAIILSDIILSKLEPKKNGTFIKEERGVSRVDVLGLLIRQNRSGTIASDVTCMIMNREHHPVAEEIIM